MIDPKIAADAAAREIYERLSKRGLMDAGIAPFVEPLISAIVVAAITRCVPAPSEGMGR